MKYKVNLKEVGLEDANKAYGGFLDAFSFHKTNFKDWFNVFRDDCLKAMETKTFFPVYRMADGEYRFLMGRAYNFYKRPLIKELIAVTAEKLHIKNSIYDIIVVIDYNLNPIKKKKGSAIFLHITKKDYTPTLGCIALSKKDLLYLLSIINKNTFLKII